MNKTFEITIRDKIASHMGNNPYVCGNSDFKVVFDFDEEWSAFPNKTARFISGSKYQDVIFSGNECAVPIISNAYNIKVGVFAGELHTTTPAEIPAVRSILCGTGTPVAPSEDVYAQIMDLLNGLNQDIGDAVAKYLEDNPIEGTTFTTDETLTLDQGVLSVNTADTVEADNTLPVTSAAVQTTVGNIEVLLKTI